MSALGKNVFLSIVVFLLPGCGQLYELVYCEYGKGGIENKFYQTGVNLLDRCLALEQLSDQQRVEYLQALAWGHFNLNDSEQAVANQELAFELRPPEQHHEFINYAAYLRGMGLYAESLQPLKQAQKLDQLAGYPRMLTQYNLGWSLYALGHYQQAIDAFNTGLPQRPDYAFAYLRRGLAYHKLGKHDFAREDFLEFLMLVGDKQVSMPDDIKSDIESLPAEYAEIKSL